MRPQAVQTEGAAERKSEETDVSIQKARGRGGIEEDLEDTDTEKQMDKIDIQRRISDGPKEGEFKTEVRKQRRNGRKEGGGDAESQTG